MLRAVALAAVLAFSQAAASAHLDLDDAHPTGETCVLCVGLSVLGAGNVAAPQLFDIVKARAPSVDYALSHWLGSRAEHRFPRGPPLAS